MQQDLDTLFHSSRWDANNHTFYGNPLLDEPRILTDESARMARYAETASTRSCRRA